jgi:hypothetical protein
LKREVPAKALIVESSTRGRSDSLHLQSALTTDEDLPFGFTLKTAGSVDPTSIAEYSLVILNDAGSIAPALADSISKFVSNGGQLIVATGPRTEFSSFNNALQQVMPATLTESVQTKAGETVAISDVKFDHPIFEVFQQSGRLAAAHVIGYFRSQPAANATVLARFKTVLRCWSHREGTSAFVYFVTRSAGMMPTPCICHSYIRWSVMRERARGIRGTV